MKFNSQDREQVDQYQKQLEEESILIELRNREIIKIRKELEILKAKAALAGGYKFRSAFVDLPYSFLRDAVDSAQRLAPKKNKEEVLIGLLDKESKEFENFKSELRAVESAIKEKGGEVRSETEELEQTALVSGQDTASQKEPVPDETAFKTAIQSMAQQLEIKQKEYDQHKSLVKIRGVAFEQGKLQPGGISNQSKLTPSDKKLLKEMAEIEDSIQELIALESELDVEELEILKKRIEKIDVLMKKTLSRAVVSDLTVERERIEERLSQIELRRDFLSKELERFKLSESSPKP